MSGAANNNNNNDDDGLFHPFVYPQANMLVQSGSRVTIKDLTSEKGRLLNGRHGTAIDFFPDRDGRWSVQLEDEKEKVVMMIRINNLLYSDSGSLRFSIVTRGNPCWASGSENGRVLLVAGKMDGCPALCLYDSPSREGFDAEAIYARCPYMGFTKDLVEQLLENCRRLGV